MAARAEALSSKAIAQVDTLIEFVSDLDDADLRRPCPGREKLGDGTVGTLVAHTTANYQRIAAFAAGAEGQSQAPSKIAHRIPHLGRLAGHFGRHKRPDHGHDDLPAAGGGDVNELGAQLATARRDLARIAELDDRQLDSIPPEGAFRFCDGNRSLDEVLTALLTHQGHQVEALARREGFGA